MKRFNLALATGLLYASIAQGAIVFTLDDPVQSGTPGSAVSFIGTIENTGPEDLLLGINQSFLPVVGSPFTVGIPLGLAGPLGAGQSFVGEMFTVLIDPTALPGAVLVTVATIEDGAGLVAPSNAITIQVTVADVPEPGSVFLIGCALLGSLGCRKWLPISSR